MKKKIKILDFQTPPFGVAPIENYHQVIYEVDGEKMKYSCAREDRHLTEEEMYHYLVAIENGFDPIGFFKVNHRNINTYIIFYEYNQVLHHYIYTAKDKQIEANALKEAYQNHKHA
jgi:hypothetical protein